MVVTKAVAATGPSSILSAHHQKEVIYMDLLNLILAVVVLAFIITAWKATRHTK